MQFQLDKTLEILQQTPDVLQTLLQNLSDEWMYNNEGENTWSAFDVVGHLIVCEQTDFIPRARIILSDSANRILPAIDMYAQFELSKGKSMRNLLEEFKQLREEGIKQILELNLSEEDYERSAIHRKIGDVKLKELLATWAAHDLIHIAQIARVMAKQYKYEVGPFIEFLRILK